MVQSSRELDLSQKAVGAERRGKIRMKHLERHEPLVFSVLCQVNGRHPATPEFTVDDIRLCKRVAQALERKWSLHHIA